MPDPGDNPNWRLAAQRRKVRPSGEPPGGPENININIRAAAQCEGFNMKRLLTGMAVGIMFSSVAMAQNGSSSRFASSRPASGVPMRAIVTVRGPRGPMATFRGPMMRRFRRPMMGPWWENPWIARRIALTDEQRRQLEKISFQNRLRMIDLRAALEKQRLLLQPILQSERPNEDQALGQIDKIGQARTELDRARVQAMLAARNVLTPEQWRKLREARQSRPRVMRYQAWPGRGQPPAPPTPPAISGR
jgi:Spy/CpxP family protein refolding chaperone